MRYAVARCDIREAGWAVTCVKVEENRVEVRMGVREEGTCRCMIKRDPVVVSVRSS